MTHNLQQAEESIRILLTSLSLASEDTGPQFLPSGYPAAVVGVTSRRELTAHALDPTSPLWWFCGPLAYAKFGADALQLHEADQRSTVAIVSPPFIQYAPIVSRELEALGCNIASRRVVYSATLCALLYGGYPWFPAFRRAIHELGIVDQPATVLDVGLSRVLTLADLTRHKLRIRELLPEPLKVNYPGMLFPGLVRSLHMPEPLEVERHVCASLL